MTQMPHFVTGDFQSHFALMDDKTYGLALDSIVKACVDILLTDGGERVLLLKRRVFPAPHHWFCGGRARPGEAPAHTARRHVRRELKLDIDASRFFGVVRERVRSRATMSTLCDCDGVKE